METEFDLSVLFERLKRGDRQALDELLPHVYRELRGLAGALMRGERRDHSLPTTALVHEAYLKLADRPLPHLDSLRGFIAMTARAMRQILVDHERRRRAKKRGGHWRRLDVSEDVCAVPAPVFEDLVALDEALERLKDGFPRCAAVVELRVFGGLTAREAAAVLGSAVRTVERDWKFALAVLLSELGGGRVGRGHAATRCSST
ncbi:MAG: ECF-type sigma factor [Dehalococcoidia bacterium]